MNKLVRYHIVDSNDTDHSLCGLLYHRFNKADKPAYGTCSHCIAERNKRDLIKRKVVHKKQTPEESRA